PGVHSIAIELYFVQPFGAVRCVLNELGQLRFDPRWRRVRRQAVPRECGPCPRPGLARVGDYWNNPLREIGGVCWYMRFDRVWYILRLRRRVASSKTQEEK